MTHRGNPGPVHRLKLVTLLFALSPELLFLGAAVKLRDNGYDGLLVAINPRVPENLNLITNIKVSGSYAVDTMSPLFRPLTGFRKLIPPGLSLNSTEASIS